MSSAKFNVNEIAFTSAAVKATLVAWGEGLDITEGGRHFPGFVLAKVREWYGNNTSKAAIVGEKAQVAKEFASKVRQTWGGKGKLATVTTASREQFLLTATGPAKQLVDCDASFAELEEHGINLEFAPVGDSELAKWLAELGEKCEVQHKARREEIGKIVAPVVA